MPGIGQAKSSYPFKKLECHPKTVSVRDQSSRCPPLLKYGLIMENIILTRNVFILRAFREMLSECECECECECKNICIVDLDSCRSLHELLHVIKNANLNSKHKLFFIKGVSIFSKMLASITAFSVRDSLAHQKKVILAGRAPNYAFVAKYIRSYKNMSLMTHRENLIAQGLLKYRDVPSMARALNLNHKTIYSRVRAMTIKLNLRDIGQLRQFIFSEMVSCPPLINTL